MGVTNLQGQCLKQHLDCKPIHITNYNSQLTRNKMEARVMKLIVSKKKKLEEFETMMLNKDCNAILQRTMTPKLNVPRCFIIPSSIGSSFSTKALCNGR